MKSPASLYDEVSVSFGKLLLPLIEHDDACRSCFHPHKEVGYVAEYSLHDKVELVLKACRATQQLPRQLPCLSLAFCQLRDCNAVTLRIFLFRMAKKDHKGADQLLCS